MSGASTAAAMVPQGMPNLGVPLVNPNGTLSYAWYQFLVSVFNALLKGGLAPGTTLSGVQGSVTDLQNALDGLAVVGLTGVAISGGSPLPADVATYLKVTFTNPGQTPGQPADVANYAIPMFVTSA